MAQYKSFSNLKQKIQILWDDIKQSKNDTNNLQKISIDLKNSDFTKRIVRITVSPKVLLNGEGGGGGGG